MKLCVAWRAFTCCPMSTDSQLQEEDMFSDRESIRHKWGIHANDDFLDNERPERWHNCVHKIPHWPWWPPSFFKNLINPLRTLLRKPSPPLSFHNKCDLIPPLQWVYLPPPERDPFLLPTLHIRVHVIHIQYSGRSGPKRHVVPAVRRYETLHTLSSNVPSQVLVGNLSSPPHYIFGAVYHSRP